MSCHQSPANLNVVVLAGGLGSRLAEETEVRPKPMVEIGGRPILWHILKHYSHFGFKSFFVALGYKGDVIKRYFLEYQKLAGSIRVDLTKAQVDWLDGPRIEDWTLHLMETGLQTPTGGRIRCLRPWLEKQTFLATYGDGVSNIDLHQLLTFHRARGKLVTLTAVRPPARFGGLEFDGDQVVRFTEKPQIGEGWINAGFFVMEPGVFDYLKDGQMSLESDVLEHLAADGQLAAYRHPGFWQCMDTLRDKNLLESLWKSGQAPWRMWDES